MANDEATVPMQAPSDHPTWPATPPSPLAGAAGSSRSPRPLSQPFSMRRGCGVALLVAGAFIAGAIISALVFSALFLPSPSPATSSNPGNGSLRVTITDAFLNEALSSNAGGSLSHAQAHIQSNGEITISGELQSVILFSGQNAVIVLAPSVVQNKLTIKAVSASVGGVPLPALALTPITSSLNQQLAQASAPSLGGGQSLTVKSVTFTNGEMTIIYI